MMGRFMGMMRSMVIRTSMMLSFRRGFMSDWWCLGDGDRRGGRVCYVF
jgi:hypothetical protein